jgi:hypothetical protein
MPKIRLWLPLLISAFALWALCGGVMGVGMALLPLQMALVVHAIATPVIAGCISLVYFRKFGTTSPSQTAGAFTLFVIMMDFFVVALLIERSFEMFTSFIGTWLPFVLIFTATYMTGKYAGRR